MEIDFEQPLELIADGTRVTASRVTGRPWFNLRRTDGQAFTVEQAGYKTFPNDSILVDDCGVRLYGPDTGKTVVRNVWGAEIQVDGVRPAWLKDGVKILRRDRDEDDHAAWGWPTPFEVGADDLCWGDWISHIRLPVDHFAYKAIAAGFEPWAGGYAAPDDWAGGEVLWRNGRNVHDDDFCWGDRTGVNDPDSESQWDIIGYRKMVVEPAKPSQEPLCPDEPLPATWGELIPITGERPPFLRDGDELNWIYDVALDITTWSMWDAADWGAVRDAGGIRLRSDHPYYSRRTFKPGDRVRYTGNADWADQWAGDLIVVDSDRVHCDNTAVYRASDPIQVVGHIATCDLIQVVGHIATCDLIAAPEETHRTLIDAEIDEAAAAWLLAPGSGGRAAATFFARRWGLLPPEKTPLDRFMDAHPDADRATAELALGFDR